MSEIASTPTNSSTSTSSDEISLWTPSDGFESILALDIKPFDQVMAEIGRLVDTGGKDPVHRYHFPSYELMHRILAPNRIAIIRAMAGQGPLSIREVARRVGRDFKGVHTDITALLNNGLVKKTADGKVVFPFMKLHLQFEFGADQTAA